MKRQGLLCYLDKYHSPDRQSYILLVINQLSYGFCYRILHKANDGLWDYFGVIHNKQLTSEADQWENTLKSYCHNYRQLIIIMPCVAHVPTRYTGNLSFFFQCLQYLPVYVASRCFQLYSNNLKQQPNLKRYDHQLRRAQTLYTDIEKLTNLQD